CSSDLSASAPTDDPLIPVAGPQPSMAIAAAGAASAAIGSFDPSFHATGEAGSLVVTNQAQEFSARLDRNGFLVQAGTSSWGLSLTGIGRGAVLAAPDSGTLDSAANRVEARRGLLTEWYANGPLGLEHGFTLAAPPAASATNGPVVLTLRQLGARGALATEDGRGLRIAPAGNTSVLYYGGLVAY